jgi:hypothetical protein
MLPRQRAIDKRQVNLGAALPFYLGMKSHFALLLVLGSVAAQAASQPQGAPRPVPASARVPELRAALQQYHPGSAAVPLRLTADQRAELRRQLTEYGPPPWATTVAAPTQRKDP